MTDTTGTHNYAYDQIYRLTQAAHPAISTEQFSYDPVGNRQNSTVDAANRLLEDANYTYSYDNNGNLIQKISKATGAVTAYAYDSENRLVQLQTPNSQLITYKYDPFGRRIEKNVNGIITRYVYDREDILFELDASGNIITEYVHGPGIDEPIAMIKGGQTYHYHADGLGSIIAITDSSGNVVQRYEYNSFGEITYQQDPTFKQPYTYTGREYDEESGLYYYRARYYDAKVGRFISEDPIYGKLRNPLTQNRYVYALGNPLFWIDPSGLTVTCVYSQSTGQLLCTDDDAGDVVVDTSQCYAGRGIGRNDPDWQDVKDVGPTPVGPWQIGPGEDRPGRTGDMSLPLSPLPGNDVFNTKRTPNKFWIHGNNRSDNASKGCPVCPRPIRDAINDRGGGTFHVIY